VRVGVDVVRASIPLLLETLPSAKQVTIAVCDEHVEISHTHAQFRDAIESLSPEMKRFATAMRQMQVCAHCDEDVERVVMLMLSLTYTCSLSLRCSPSASST
jgi:hypothetical protein